MNLVIDNTIEKNEANTTLWSVYTGQENAKEIYIIQITQLDGEELEVLSRHTHNEYFTTKDAAELKIEILKGKLGATNRLYFVQTLWPHKTGPKITIGN